MSLLGGYIMAEIIALAWGIGFSTIGIYLFVKGKLRQKPVAVFSLFLTFALGGGIAIGYRDRLTSLKVLGIEIETIRKEINQIKTVAINDIKREVAKEKGSINLLMGNAKVVEARLQETIKTASMPRWTIDPNMFYIPDYNGTLVYYKPGDPNR